MNDFQIAYEAWAPKISHDGHLSQIEQLALSNLKEACSRIWDIGWWHEYVCVGNHSRGLHCGVNFGFKVRGEKISEAELTQSVRKVVAEHEFNFEKGELTEFE